MAAFPGSRVRYFPFPGTPNGRWTKLGGDPADVTAHSRSFVEQGCAGCDTLAHRATEADPIDPMPAARRGLRPKKHLIVASAVTSAERVKAIDDAGADAFAIGTAILDGSNSPTKHSLLSQLRDALADCARL